MADVSGYENKNITVWNDLDDLVYNNHFSNGQCYIQVHFNREFKDEKPSIIKLPIYPEDIAFGATTNYADASILGRPGNISGYVGTSDVTTRINLHLHRELAIPGELNTDRNKIDELIALIQACCYPRTYQDGMCVPIVEYVFGDTKIIGKQTSFNTKWGGPKIGNSYMEATLDIAITHVPMGIIFYDDVKTFNPRQFI